MNELYTSMYNDFQVFFAGMPEDVASLAVTSIMAAAALFFAALPFLIFRSR